MNSQHPKLIDNLIIKLAEDLSSKGAFINEFEREGIANAHARQRGIEIEIEIAPLPWKKM